MTFLPLLFFPVLNASLNAARTVFLLFGFYFIRRCNVFAHRICMVSAFRAEGPFLRSLVSSRAPL